VDDPAACTAGRVAVGARQIGKTTLMLQCVDVLLRSGVPAANILYATFDHPVLKLAGVDAVLDAWREREPKVQGPEYLFLDEAQFIRRHGYDLGTWVKHQVDFRKERRIAFTRFGHAVDTDRSRIRCGPLAHHQTDDVVVLRVSADQATGFAAVTRPAESARLVRVDTC
jgi:hypothetical protein